jgi:hypothetical protein
MPLLFHKVMVSGARASITTDTPIPMIRLALKHFEKILLQLNPVDSSWPFARFWNDPPARVYY